MKIPAVSRRDFVKAAAVASSTVPYLFTSRSAMAEDANSKKTIAAIGVGGSRGRYKQGTWVARAAKNLGQLIAVCDVDQVHNEEFNANDGDGKLAMFQDYRKMFEKIQPDVVTIGTPDHWHVAIAIAAMQAGCNVYCEKPVTLTIDEGKKIRKAVEKYGKVFQVGSQQRSEFDQKFLKAVAIVQLGLLGDDVTAELAIGGAPDGGPFKPQPVPEGIDWDMWLGPAPKRPYMEERRRFFRWFLEYAGGKMADWGAHHIDIAQWAVSPESGPVKINYGSAAFQQGVNPADYDAAAFFNAEATLPHLYNAPTSFHLDLAYPNGGRIGVHSDYESEDGETKFPNGILFRGSKGYFFVNRGKLAGQFIDNMSETDTARVHKKMIQLYGGPITWHMQNFFDCIADRDRTPISDIASQVRTANTCHICNICTLLGRDLAWDPKEERFIDDDVANALTSRTPRKGYDQELNSITST